MNNTKLKGRMSGKIQELQQPTVGTEIAAAETASVDSDYLALNNNALDIIRANLKSQPLTLDLFDLVKSPSGGSTVFSIPGLAGDEPEKELVGIVLDYTTPRAYWDTPDPVEGTPPVCMSQNSTISHDGKSRALCPYNDFGSKDGDSNAKACKESVLLFLLRPFAALWMKPLTIANLSRGGGKPGLSLRNTRSSAKKSWLKSRGGSRTATSGILPELPTGSAASVKRSFLEG